jgi:hypothetical protein
MASVRVSQPTAHGCAGVTTNYQFKDRPIMHDLKVTRLRRLRKMNVSYNDLLKFM